MKRAINLYLDEEVIEKLQALADSENVSMSKSVAAMTWIFYGELLKPEKNRYFRECAAEKEFNNAVTTNDKEIK
jgi:hypothetical protein